MVDVLLRFKKKIAVDSQKEGLPVRKQSRESLLAQMFVTRVPIRMADKVGYQKCIYPSDVHRWSATKSLGYDPYSGTVW